MHTIIADPHHWSMLTEDDVSWYLKLKFKKYKYKPPANLLHRLQFEDLDLLPLVLEQAQPLPVLVPALLRVTLLLPKKHLEFQVKIYKHAKISKLEMSEFIHIRTVFRPIY